MVWFAIIASAVAYATFLAAGSIVTAEASGAYLPVMIRDDVGPGSHRLSGMIMVPSPCDELLVRTESLGTTTRALIFSTWRDPSLTCIHGETPRSFHATVFAPSADAKFVATLDGAGFPIMVIPTIAGRNQ